MRPLRHHARALLTSTFLVSVLSACDTTQPIEPDASTLDMSGTADAGADAGPVVEDDADVRVDPSDEKSPIEQAQPYVEGELPWGDPLISMGSGRVTLEETLQGDIHRWEAGPQGGYHLWVACAIDAELLQDLSDEELSALTILYRVWRDDGTLLARTQRLGGLTLDDEGRWVSVGQYAVLEAPVRPRRMDDEQLLFRVDVSLPGEDEPRHRASWITSECCD